MNKMLPTTTHKFAAIQLKLMHLDLYRSFIHDNQARIIELSNSFESDRAKLKGMYSAVYNIINMFIVFEHAYTLVDDIFATQELKNRLSKEQIKSLGEVKKVSLRWKKVRNKLGGHVDIEMFESFCESRNYKGVFLSDDLGSDLSLLNMMLITKAVNEVRDKFDIFGRDLDFDRNGIPAESKLFMEKINADWEIVFTCFKKIGIFMYEIGKSEKMSIASQKESKGIVVDG